MAASGLSRGTEKLSLPHSFLKICISWLPWVLVAAPGVFKLQLTGSSFGALTLECAGSVIVAQAWLPLSMWNLNFPTEPVSSVLEGGFLTIAPTSNLLWVLPYAVPACGSELVYTV